MQYRRVAVVLVLISTLIGLGQQLVAQAPADPFFGLHVFLLGRGTTWPAAQFGSIRLWDVGTTWWDLETVQGKWDFERLDSYVLQAEAHNVDVLLVLGQTPPWAAAHQQDPPRNLSDWSNYVRTVATRYRGRIRAYEVWNEPNCPYFFSGSVEDMIALSKAAAEALKDVDPGAKLVSPSATGGMPGEQWLQSFLEGGGGQYVDVIGFHFYVLDAPEEMLPHIETVWSIMRGSGFGHLPLWNTETGWYIQNTPVGDSGWALPQQKSADYLLRAYILSRSEKVERFYWYGYDDNAGLVELDKMTPKLALLAYKWLQQWVEQSTSIDCSQAEDGTFVCHVVGHGSDASWVIWNPAGERYFGIPLQWNAGSFEMASGLCVNIAGHSIRVGTTPVRLLRNRCAPPFGVPLAKFAVKWLPSR